LKANIDQLISPQMSTVMLSTVMLSVIMLEAVKLKAVILTAKIPEKSRLLELCYVPATSPCSYKDIFVAATNNTNPANKAGSTYH
jgi:hypothetical protein